MGREAARKHFARLSENLAALDGKYSGLAACPFCLRLFDEGAIDLEQPELTEEHIIPSELGGTLTTLTCKTCNNTHGSKIDAHLIQMLRSRDSIEGLSDKAFRGRIEVAGMTVPTDIEWKRSIGETTNFALRQFNPSVHDAMRREMISGNVSTVEVTMIFDYIPERVNIGLLRIGYLSLFRLLGYPYVLSPAASVIRELITSQKSRDVNIGEFVGVLGGDTQRFGKPIQHLRLEGDKAIMVIITLTTEVERVYVAFMPSPDIPAEAVFPALRDAAQSLNRRAHASG